MDFALTDDQQMIRESASRLVADRGKRSPGALGFDRELWNETSELGWIGAGIAPELGGFGGPIETALIAEEFGRGSIGGDFLGAAVLGPQLLVAAGATPQRVALLDDVMSGKIILAAAFSEAVARGDADQVTTRAVGGPVNYRLSGKKTLVLAGDVADHLIVSARTDDGGGSGVSLFMVDPRSPGVTIVPTPLVDGSSAATVRFEDARAALLGVHGGASAALNVMGERGIACIAAESLGMMEAVADITAEYFRNRSQFGVLLGQFQVLQHKLADMVIDAEMQRATLMVALAAFELAPGPLRQRRMSGAKAASGAALRRVTGSGVQAHGGMGMTIEYPVGHYMQRMVVLDSILGAPSYHLGVCARALAA